MTTMDQENCQTVMAVCGVPLKRAQQLLEAATGSVERAVDIHFTQRRHIETKELKEKTESAQKDKLGSKTVQTLAASSSTKAVASPTKRSAPPTQQQHQSSLRKQRKIDAFFSSPVSSNERTRASLKGSQSPTNLVAAVATAESGNREDGSNDASLSNVSSIDPSSLMSRPNLNVSTTGRDQASLPYSLLVATFSQMAATTKRNVKLQSLKELFAQVLQKCREEPAHLDKTSQGPERLLTCVLELTLARIVIQGDVIDESPNTTIRSASYSQPLPLQVSGSSISTSVQQVTGASRKQLSEAYRQMGDLGDVAAHFFVDQEKATIQKFLVRTASSITTAGLSVQQVHNLLTLIATVSQGKGSQASRQNLVVRLLRACRDKEEIRFVVRTLLGNMRLGATIKTVLAGLAMAVDDMDTSKTEEGSNGDLLNKNDPVQRLQNIYHVCPRLNEIAHALLHGGLSYAEKACTLAVGFPVEPMLANPAQSMEQVEKFLANECGIAEWKYDGMRCQAHWDGKQARLFSRHLLDCTEQYPDAVQYMTQAKNSNVSSFVLDAEIVGVVSTTLPDGRTSFRLLPFQDLSTRRSTREKSDQVQIRVYAFDLMHLNGESLLKQPHHCRWAQLRASFGETEGFALAKSVVLPSYDESLVQCTLQQAIQEGAEGLMIKLSGTQKQPALSTTPHRTYGYEAGTRSHLWLKLKKDYVSGYYDTIDVVPIGAWFGNGRKAQKGFLSPVLLAVYDEDEGVFQSISRCMSFSDDMYTAMREYYFRGTPYPSGVGIVAEVADEKVQDEGSTVPSERQGAVSSSDTESHSPDDDGDADNAEDNSRVNCFPCRPSSTLVVTNENPVIWFKPSEVWEVSFADLTLSRTHTAARDRLNASGRGIALRFPRFKRRRPDKSIEEATTTRQLAELFAAQSKISF